VFFISIFKRENRRAGKVCAVSNDVKPIIPEGITSKDRRTIDDRRNDIGRRTGLYYRLPEDQKGTVDTILNILERKLEK